MKRQSQILAGSAIALLMASAPLSALPLDRVASPVTDDRKPAAAQGPDRLPRG
jgi:hypothetical protein